jgi:putative FmdB family regulatory protein
MPVYEYFCESCQKKFERVKSVRVSDKERDNDICACGKKAKLVPSRPGHPILVGSGFFCNDYGQPTR